jgi:hypothetical protein
MLLVYRHNQTSNEMTSTFNGIIEFTLCKIQYMIHILKYHYKAKIIIKLVWNNITYTVLYRGTQYVMLYLM